MEQTCIPWFGYNLSNSLGGMEGCVTVDSVEDKGGHWIWKSKGDKSNDRFTSHTVFFNDHSIVTEKFDKRSQLRMRNGRRVSKCLTDTCIGLKMPDMVTIYPQRSRLVTDGRT